MCSSRSYSACLHPLHRTAWLSIHLNRFCFTLRIIPTLATLLLLPLLLSLGVWQLNRAEQKRALLTNYHQRAHATPLTLTQLNDPRAAQPYYPVAISGRYDNQHQFLLDNRTHQHQIGYQVLTPFLPTQGDKVLLVNRGWIPRGAQRQQLPALPAITGQQTVQGTIYTPAKPFLLSRVQEDSNRWPRRIQAVEIPSLANQLGRPLYPFIVLLAPQAPNGFVRDWQPITLSPAKHWSYAVQWFALAAALLIIFVVVNTHRFQRQSDEP